MAFGNPYGDEWNQELIAHWTAELVKRGALIISLSDTIGSATSELVGEVYKNTQNSFPQIELGIHLHSTPEHWEEKINAAYLNGCRRFDSAIKGYGGCPMATDTLTGNIATEKLISFLMERKENLNINTSSFEKAMSFSSKIFR